VDRMVPPAASATRPSMRRTISRDSYVAAFTRLERLPRQIGERESLCDVTHRSAVQLRRSGVYIARLGAAAPARNHRHTHADGWLARLPSRRVTPRARAVTDYVRVK
jgi:hypothetical protein